jgi:decaprenylphospho-beta-D-erythro-pentofuranosid-2-ulose 2-reductase
LKDRNLTTPAGTALIMGATSDIGRAAALRFAGAGWTIQLAGRDAAGLDREVADIQARTGVAVSAHRLDILDMPSFAAFMDSLEFLPDVAVSVVGLLGDAERTHHDPAHAVDVMRSNYEGPAIVLGMLAERFVARGSGTLIGISSVAGDRGRSSNTVYGSSKAGFTAFLSGLRNRLFHSGVRVVTIKPGFVRTKMTQNLKLPPIVTAEADEVAAVIFKAGTGGGADVVYVRSIWALIMLIITAIPETVFKRMHL